ncbi:MULTISPECIES: hypothetical protein [Enterobacterales]|uniref:hypothetical protein n=1 Tax=Enterobacterales TaxID=91347 RepID=UPI002EDB42D0
MFSGSGDVFLRVLQRNIAGMRHIFRQTGQNRDDEANADRIETDCCKDNNQRFQTADKEGKSVVFPSLW